MKDRTHDISLIDFHVRDVEALGKILDNAAAAAFPRSPSNCYFDVYVLLLSWDNDDLGVAAEIDDLEKVFRNVYGYRVDRWKIPSSTSYIALVERIMHSLRDMNTKGKLFITYYGGHGYMNEDRQCVWLCNRQINASTVHSGDNHGKGVTEVIAACGFEAFAPSVGEHSFTRNLIEELKYLSHKFETITTVLLHNKVLSRIKKSWNPRYSNSGSNERRTTPIHIHLTDDTTQRCIKLAPLRARDLPTDSPQSLPDFPVQSPGPSASVSEDVDMLGSEETSQSSNEVWPDKDFDSPKVLISIALQEEQYLNADDFLDWLKSVPALAKRVHIEGVYKSDSTLLHLSLPIAIWDLLPKDPAISFLAFVRSRNLLDSSSPSGQKQLEALKGAPLQYTPKVSPGALSRHDNPFSPQTSANADSYRRPDSKMDAHLATFDQAYCEDLNIDSEDHKPQNVPWSPWQYKIERHLLAEDLPSALAIGLHPPESKEERPVSSENFDEALDLESFSDTDTLVDLAIDYVHPPSILGPIKSLSEMVEGSSYKAKMISDPETKIVEGGRYRPLISHGRPLATKTQRTQDACWPCFIKWDKCLFESDADKSCNGCKKRKRTAFLVQDCVKMRLPDLTSVFIPESLAKQQDPEKLFAFASTSVHRWLDNHFAVLLTWGYYRPIKVDATEIEAVGTNLLVQDQYRLNLATNQYERIQVPSLPLGMQLMSVVRWRKELDRYLEELLERDFQRFPKVCFRGNHNVVQHHLLLSIFEYHESVTHMARDLVHQSLKLVVLTYIMTHTWSLAENTEGEVYRRLRNPPPGPVAHQTGARLLDTQIKFLLSTLHRDILEDVLNKMQDTVRTNCQISWAPLLVSMVIMAMTVELLEANVRCKEEVAKQEGMLGAEDRTADEEITLMDEKFNLLKRSFHQRYKTLLPKAFNPLHKPQQHAGLDYASQSLAAKAGEIIIQNRKSIRRY
ncbi:MAG: hypothetical protein Q9213_004653 [Squamulea squamosa]